MLRRKLARLLDNISQWLYPHERKPPLKGAMVGDRFTDASGTTFVWCRMLGPGEAHRGHSITTEQINAGVERTAPLA
jgi:hypothetical protein